MVLSLPADIFLLVLTNLDTKDVLNFRKTSKDSYELSKSRSVWDSLLRRCIIEESIPLPGLAGRSLESLNAEELEGLHRRALELHRNWQSDSPVVKQSFQLVSSVAQIVRLEILPGRHDGRWLLSLSRAYGEPRYVLRCWDLRQAHPVCIAQKTFGLLGGMVVNKTTNETDCIAALTSSGIEILSLVGSATNPSEGFVTSKTIPVPMIGLHYFQDRRIITMDSDARVFLLDIDYPQVKVEFQHSRDSLKDFVLTNTFILIMKSETLELYPLLSSLAAVPGHIIVPPIFVYHWPWPVVFGVMNLRHPLGIKSMNDPITMFIRFGNFMMPWPNNSIHQYKIRPNSYFVSSEFPSEMNVPYAYPPLLMGTIAAPIRLAAPTDLALGQYGTAVWLDSHTEIYYQESRGQRVAGAFAGLEARTQNLDQSGDESDADNPESRRASFVFAHQREESWTRLTLDEEEGVIFLGRSSGVIDIFKYGT